MLLHGIAGPRNQSSPNSENKCPLADSNHAKVCGDLTTSVQDIRDQKFVLPKKWAKMHQNHLRLATI